jgi:hypothetical protein
LADYPHSGIGTLGDGVAIAILLALLAATKGASYRISEPEVKAALATARVAKRKRAPNLCGASVFETRCGVFVVDIV